MSFLENRPSLHPIQQESRTPQPSIEDPMVRQLRLSSNLYKIRAITSNDDIYSWFENIYLSLPTTTLEETNQLLNIYQLLSQNLFSLQLEPHLTLEAKKVGSIIAKCLFPTVASNHDSEWFWSTLRSYKLAPSLFSMNRAFFSELLRLLIPHQPCFAFAVGQLSAILPTARTLFPEAYFNTQSTHQLASAALHHGYNSYLGLCALAEKKFSTSDQTRLVVQLNNCLFLKLIGKPAAYCYQPTELLGGQVLLPDYWYAVDSQSLHKIWKDFVAGKRIQTQPNLALTYLRPGSRSTTHCPTIDLQRLLTTPRIAPRSSEQPITLDLLKRYHENW